MMMGVDRKFGLASYYTRYISSEHGYCGIFGWVVEFKVKMRCGVTATWVQT